LHASSSMVTPIDLDAEPIDDDIVPVHVPRPEAKLPADDEDLLEIAYRDVTKAAADSLDEHAEEMTEPSHAIPPQPRMFDEDTDEAAA
jgi:hypothetical protein